MLLDPILLIGEITVDFTLASNLHKVKMRLGGIVHAARGLWACNIPYSVAAICPSYLKEQAEQYLRAHGCTDFFIVASINGAPNVFVINDARETGHQGYEDLLRETRTAVFSKDILKLHSYQDVVMFPGSYCLKEIASNLSPTTKVTIDIAYGIDSLRLLEPLHNYINDILISTSSELFSNFGSGDIQELIDLLKPIATRMVLKENRGGSRLFTLNETKPPEEICTHLSNTINSVGVGDVYSAVFAAFSRSVPNEAGWRATQVAVEYALTTFPDDFKRNALRALNLSISEVKGLSGISLPWHERRSFQIYLAAPDFSYVDRTEIDKVINSLNYHNFVLRRPIIENGEATIDSRKQDLNHFYYSDIELLRECDLVFAVPLDRDPGTLFEMGFANALNKPIITFDPQQNNRNTMVMCGSLEYSNDLDICLNATFSALSKLRRL